MNGNIVNSKLILNAQFLLNLNEFWLAVFVYQLKKNNSESGHNNNVVLSVSSLVIFIVIGI